MVSTRTLTQFDPEIATLVQHETKRQEYGLEMIPSENFVSEAVLEANGSVLTNKYAEGLPRKRYYGGCECVDGVEEIAIARAKQLFGAEFVNAQPHSGAQANHAVFEAFLAPGDTIMGMRLDHGGHLTHGSPYNVSGKRYKIVAYGVREDTHLIDPDQVRDTALQNKPKLIICGASAYSRVIDFKFFADIAKEVGAILLADVAHYAGLIVGGVYPSPVPHADIVSTTTHKTLRGPRSGLLMGKEVHATVINKAVFPGLQGGPHMHTIAAKAVAFKEALEPSFKEYAKQTVLNAQALANELIAKGLKVISGGTDSHVMLVDVRPYKVTGKDAEAILAKIEITCNKNTIPFDPEKPMTASGIRLGTPALTTRGMKETEMISIAQGIASALENKDNEGKLASIREDMRGIASKFPLYRHRLVG
jgi:glycine hydroxymethyltransferase